MHGYFNKNIVFLQMYIYKHQARLNAPQPSLVMPYGGNLSFWNIDERLFSVLQ
jgi:hypothetical protein